MVKDWEPESLVPDRRVEEVEEINSTLVVTSAATTHVTIQGYDQPKLNFTTFDFLGLTADKRLKDAARDALNKYGCGSCGPRGFYGTIDVHVELEEALAAFFGCPEAIIYSDSANTPPSTIPAFAKRGDLIVADMGVNEMIRTGLMLSRAKILFHKHNDMEDLERVLKSVRDQDEKMGRKSDCQRRFIVAEGIYRNHGTILDLARVVELKHKYFFRLIVDETMSVGVLGKTGKGVTEHLDMPLESIDVLSGSLAHSFGSIGGFCVGSQEVVDHQRLSASGYVFSASSPPFVASVALKALEVMKEQPELLTTLEANTKDLVDQLQKIKGLEVFSDIRSPIVHMRISSGQSSVDVSDSAEQEAVIERLAIMVRDRKSDGVVCMPSRRMQRELVSDGTAPPVSLRLTVSAAHTKAQLKACADAIKEAVAKLL